MFHLRVKIIGRSRAGPKSVAGAIAYRAGSRGGASAIAYRAGVKLRDPITGKFYDYRKKALIDSDGFGILWTEVMLPHGAPEALGDRQALIDAVEAREKRVDAQLLREVEISLPRELTLDQQRDLVREYVRVNFVARGMIADIAIHDERASDGGRNPHVHVLLTMRRVGPEGFGNKERAWHAKANVYDWRRNWADLANEYLARFGHERRLDHRSHAAREIELLPDSFVGPSKGREFDGVIHAVRRQSRDAAKRYNAKRIGADPRLLLAAITREKATFTHADVAAAIRRTTDHELGDPEHDALMEAVLQSPELVPIAADDQRGTRYATRTMIECELALARTAQTLAKRHSHVFAPPVPTRLSVEQLQAFAHVVHGGDLVAISGVAGAGKTTTLAAIAEAYGAAGYRVRGLALAGIAAKTLGLEAGIETQTIRSALNDWARKSPQAPLERGDVLIIDEAGMVGSVDMRDLVMAAERASVKVIVVGDARQLQAIDAGAPFRAIVDTHGAAELQDVRRQYREWQRNASKLLAKHNAPEALALYRGAGAVQALETTDQAQRALVTDYLSQLDAEGAQMILAHRVADARTLNALVRHRLVADGRLGPDVAVTVAEDVHDLFGDVSERRTRAVFAEGEQILFTKNDRHLGVQNGLTGKIASLTPDGQFIVDLPDGRAVAFSIDHYRHLAPGYAATIHKAQGATYDRVFVQASNWMDANLAYVAMTRHRSDVTLYYGRDQFETPAELDQVFSRQRPKDNTLDYLDDHCRAQLYGKSTARSGGRRTTRPIPTPQEQILRSAELRRMALLRDAQRQRQYGD